MRKVAYDACFCGFALSDEAVRLGRKLSGNPAWAGAVLPGEPYEDGSVCAPILGIKGTLIDDDLPRHDEILVSVIDQLGASASGDLSQLKIAEVDGRYRIDGCNGNEKVMTPEKYEWVE